MQLFLELESEVRSYIRNFPSIFKFAKGSILKDQNNIEYIDFLTGAGSLNYGHNNSHVTKKLINYLENNYILHSLDMATKAKRDFLEIFQRNILIPRKLNYKIQFTGPTGTNAVEAALKLAKKITGRRNIIAFTNGFHGLTQGSLSITGNSYFKDINDSNTATIIPFDNYIENFDTLKYLKKVLSDLSSGINLPAAIIVETIQGDGGINVASAEWLKNLENICKEYDIIFIVDDIQVGNGRTGDFFSFEFANIKPDLVVLSKSLGGGLPIAILLIDPKYDIWKPGEHTGTFRGNNLAFVAAKELISVYWNDLKLTKEIKRKEIILKSILNNISKKYSKKYNISVRGRGLIYAFEILDDSSLAKKITNECYKNNLIIETCGSKNGTIKFLPSLLITDVILRKGLTIFELSVDKVLSGIESNKL